MGDSTHGRVAAVKLKNWGDLYRSGAACSHPSEMNRRRLRQDRPRDRARCAPPSLLRMRSR